MEVRNEYDGLQDGVSEESGLRCEDESLALDSQREEADINTIVRRFGLTGTVPSPGTLPLVTNGDFVEAMDLAEAIRLMRAADEAFLAQPAEVRKRFGNDPVEFVDFCSEVTSDGKLTNLEEMRKFGLAVPEVVPVPEKVQKVEVVNAVAPHG